MPAKEKIENILYVRLLEKKQNNHNIKKLVANPCNARDNFYNLAQSILWLKAYYNFFLTHNSTEC